jgi:hypothetical protein
MHNYPGSLRQSRGGLPKARQVYVIQDALGPLITNGYVGLCCRTLQKLFVRRKGCMLRPSNWGRMRDTTDDAKVLPYFDQYIRNPGVCAHITKPQWDPPSKVVHRWVSMCMDEIWKSTNRLRAICLHPMHLDNHEDNLGDVYTCVRMHS